MPPGRNNPCPCGSGLKYKKCCAVKDAASNVAHSATDFHRDNVYKQTESVPPDQTTDETDEQRANQASDSNDRAYHSSGSNSELIKLLDMASARETIEKLGMDDLRYLNKLIVERIKFYLQIKSKFEMKEFNPGNRVRFTSSAGEEKKGTVIRINQKTVSVAVDGEPGWWKVSPELLTRLTTPHP